VRVAPASAGAVLAVALVFPDGRLLPWRRVLGNVLFGLERSRLSRAQRREIQTLLHARDHDIGEIDGMLGEKSRVAIKAEQARLGHEVNGRAGQKLLRALR
jgi:ABC-type taurine transport system ATPase subunit